MKNNPRLRSSTFVTAVLALCLLLLLAGSGMAQSEEQRDSRHCSNRTLSGDYGMQIEGIILGLGLQLRTVSMAHYDGAGNFTGVDHVVLNGMPPDEEWRPSSATYTVNPNCTGILTFDTAPGKPPLVVHFVVVKHGTEIHGVVDGAAITLSAYKVD
jgi:hypothetical protein